MKRVALNWRRIMRKVYTGLGLGAVALVFEACYGMPVARPEGVSVTGVVKSGTTDESIKGIKVSVENVSSEDITDGVGQFWVTVPMEGVYTFRFDDIDGPANGGTFSPKSVPVDLTGGNSPLEIKLTDAE
ncbi:hypothetical protein FACS1894124_0570 [Spirochaetia bacterium]|nr:hypothetical protein FACS1894124_0570 [Spirochaetia bacterium]